MANQAIAIYSADIQGCYFEGGDDWSDPCGVTSTGDSVAIELRDDRFTISDCKFLYTTVQTTAGGSDGAISGNVFTSSQVNLNGGSGIVFSGNAFDGSNLGYLSPKYQESNLNVVYSFAGLNVVGNTFALSGIKLHWGAYHNEWVISDNIFVGGDGITMNGSFPGSTSFRLAQFEITGNEMSGFWEGQKGGIWLGETDSEVSEGLIANNLISVRDTEMIAGHDALIQIASLENSIDQGVQIKNNNLYSWNPNRPWGIKIESQFGVSAYTGWEWGVQGNTLTGTEGIHIYGGQSATVDGNTMQKPEPTGSNGTFWADQVAGQIWVEVEQTAIVQNNYIGAGAKTQKSGGGKKAVIYVDADYGSILNNSVEAHEITGTSGVDYAIRGNGAFYYNGNNYMGIGTSWASASGKTALGRPLFVEGSGATMGENNMCFDTSTATNVKYDLLRQIFSSKEGVVATATGGIRIPFQEDGQIVGVSAMCDVAPTGASILVDVHNSEIPGTIFSTQANRPEILATEFSSAVEVPDNVWVNAGQYLQVEIDQVGSTVAGEDLSVLIEWVRNCADPYP